ncbi:glycosyltransferase family 4 protein [Pedobacter gandavensis]|uniref:glycosyltransferase family 4 protein n=1 Tax=Pedobacter gandavensis TaxID=2679963 RepID=UPI002479B1D8|nr:glycosyltransferase family 4 protein [Pedobacter gandavensis]WGQ07508.1 glycosyltransferase family 4 protein [Pedobacter gandavensis]
MSSKRQKYWIVSQVFYPNETSTAFVMTKIAEQIIEIGEVHVICGSGHYHADALKTTLSLDSRIVVHRINTPSWDKNNLFLRAVSFVIATLGLSWQILKKVNRRDTVILVTNPPTLIILTAIIKKIKGFRMFAILQDIFPENLAVTGFIKVNSFFYRILLNIFNKAYRQADHLIPCGEDMKDVFKEKVGSSMPISVITNWADHEEIFPIEIDRNKYFGRELRGKIVLEFGGNIGRVQGLDRFLELFREINNPNLILLIIGDGAFKVRLQEMKSEYGLTSVIFMETKPRSEQINFLNACDIGLVTLSEGMYGLGVPSKVYNIFSAGKPVLYIGDYHSEIYRYINEFDIGWAFTWNDSEEIISFLNSLNVSFLTTIKERGRTARMVVESKFTKNLILKQYNAVLNDKVI